MFRVTLPMLVEPGLCSIWNFWSQLVEIQGNLNCLPCKSAMEQSLPYGDYPHHTTMRGTLATSGQYAGAQNLELDSESNRLDSRL